MDSDRVCFECYPLTHEDMLTFFNYTNNVVYLALNFVFKKKENSFSSECLTSQGFGILQQHYDLMYLCGS